MSDRRFYVTTSIPYVNARPHLGHALEFVQADVLARHRRRRGDHVRLLTGTDDNALKNVVAAREAGVPVAEFVDANAARFRELVAALEVEADDFIRTSSDERHRPAVERLWRECAGDLYRRSYGGLYCVGCEQFYEPSDLVGGMCPEHGVPPERVREENWFFRLSRYERKLRELIETGELRIEPAVKRNEVLSFLRSGLRDVSVSRPAERAQGWGIGVPDDPTQVVYVWFDALTNYISALGYGAGAEEYERWWGTSNERAHVIGKGILHFHAVLWPALLLSAGEPLPTTIFVHDYLTADGRKLSKSTAAGPDPLELVERFGVDAVRWWLLSDVPRVGDTDFTEQRLIDRYNADLAGGIGNLVARTTALARGLGVGQQTDFGSLREQIDAALQHFDFRRATSAIADAVGEANGRLEKARPWSRPKDPESVAVVHEVAAAARGVVTELESFLRSPSARLARLLNGQYGSRPFERILRR